ncbi:MAG: TetR family transcriptional regulator [Rhizobiaceae bacterium]|nr:TetR family transcriptional regulator [Rhizobiaceae bacterium]
MAELKEAGNARDAIVEAAAKCFMHSGYSETSIDDVADDLGATKGRIYHYYRSKAELFFDVHRHGMAINLNAIEPIARGEGSPYDRLQSMCKAHLANMLEHIVYQRVVLQGVEMHLSSSTTPKQREKLKLLMKEREFYEGLFRDVLLEGRQNNTFSFENPSFASKAVLAILNNPVLWYTPRKTQSVQEKNQVIEEFSAFAMQSVNAKQ